MSCICACRRPVNLAKALCLPDDSLIDPFGRLRERNRLKVRNGDFYRYGYVLSPKHSIASTGSDVLNSLIG